MNQHEEENATGKTATMRDIAQYCGVNQSTVSRALRDDSRLGKETITRVREVAQLLGYDPMRNQAARRLALIRHGQHLLNYTIGLFFMHSGFSQSNYFGRIHQGILQAISETDFEIYTSDQSKLTLRGELPAAYRRGDIDGVITITQKQVWREAQSMLRAEPNFVNRPTVGLVEPIEGCSAAYGDNYGGAYQAIDHLLDLGHRHIMHWHGLDPHSTDVHSRRLAAFHDAYTRRGLDPGKYLIHGPEDEGKPPPSGQNVVQALISRPEITAIIAHDDEHAVRLHKALRQAGIRVPEDISLLSYDDTEVILDDHSHNILTTVRQPLFDIGREGTMLLVRRILGEEKEDRDIVLPTELIVRRSTSQPNPERLRAGLT